MLSSGTICKLKKILGSIRSLTVRILNVSITTPQSLRLSSEYRPSLFNLVSYGSFFKPLTTLCALLCTFSRHTLSFFRYGDTLVHSTPDVV